MPKSELKPEQVQEDTQNQAEQAVRYPVKASALMTVWLAVILLIADQVTKYLAEANLEFAQPYAVMPYLNFTLVYNYGAAFSFLADMGGWQRWFFSGIAVVMSVILLVWLSRLPKVWTLEVWGINLVLSGAIGNLIDRIVAGRVTDFIDFYIGTWHYATFNIADVAITLGAIALIYSELFLKSSEQK